MDPSGFLFHFLWKPLAGEGADVLGQGGGARASPASLPSAASAPTGLSERWTLTITTHIQGPEASAGCPRKELGGGNSVPTLLLPPRSKSEVPSKFEPALLCADF